MSTVFATRTGLEGHTHDQAFRLLPVSPHQYHEILKASSEGKVTMMEIRQTNKMFDLIRRYVALYGPKSGDYHPNSWGISDCVTTVNVDPLSSDPDEDPDIEDDGKMGSRWQSKKKVDLRLGLGIHEIEFQGHTLKVLLQTLGDPVGNESGVYIYTSTVLFTDGSGHHDLLTAFCDRLLEWEVEKTDQHYNIYIFSKFWQKMATKRVRPIESVVLPEKLKCLVLDDLAEFDSVATARWYAKHGVPYKRSCLFYGPPGTGKTSFITALAGALGRNVCFLQPSHPHMTDDSLQLCIRLAPAHSLIVLEDVDALFSADRKSTSEGKSPLTFSGLLNALDGLGNPEGQIFILTTNHIERVDPALIRPGRVDLKVKFSSATRQQAAGLFQHFYPGEAELAQEFADVIAKRFGKASDGTAEAELKDVEEEELGVSMAALQQHFILCRKYTASEALSMAHSFSV